LWRFDAAVADTFDTAMHEYKVAIALVRLTVNLAVDADQPFGRP
jgi:hypothetical protein